MELQDAFRLSLISWSFWFGFVAVLYFALSRFNEMGRGHELDPPVVVRSFTTRFRYHFASFTYAGMYSLLYTSLVVLGSLPAFANDFEQWFGTVSPISDESGAAMEIGTPMWAALLLISVAPSLARGRIDVKGRLLMRNFASIPYKARSLADQVLQKIIPGDDNLSENIEATFLNRDSRKETYLQLREMVERLEEMHALKRAKRYKEFFSQNADFLESIDAKFTTLMSEAEGKAGGYAQVEYSNQIKKLARLIVCALLDVEPEEYSVRQTIRKELRIEDFEIIGWRFKGSQLPLMVVTVLTVGLLGSIIAGFLTLASIREAQIDSQLLLQFSPRAMILSLFAVPVLVLPLLFVSGIRMYLIDQHLFHRSLEWDEILLFHFVAVVGAFLVAFLPITVVGVLLSGSNETPPNLMAMLPWALPAAGIASVYFVVSEKPLKMFGNSGPLRAVFDFGVHAIVGASLGYAAALLSLAMGLNSAYLALPPSHLPFFSAIVLAILGGTMGAIQSGISRQLTG